MTLIHQMLTAYHNIIGAYTVDILSFNSLSQTPKHKIMYLNIILGLNTNYFININVCK